MVFIDLSSSSEDESDMGSFTDMDVREILGLLEGSPIDLTLDSDDNFEIEIVKNLPTEKQSFTQTIATTPQQLVKKSPENKWSLWSVSKKARTLQKIDDEQNNRIQVQKNEPAKYLYLLLDAWSDLYSSNFRTYIKEYKDTLYFSKQPDYDGDADDSIESPYSIIRMKLNDYNENFYNSKNDISYDMSDFKLWKLGFYRFSIIFTCTDARLKIDYVERTYREDEHPFADIIVFGQLLHDQFIIHSLTDGKNDAVTLSRKDMDEQPSTDESTLEYFFFYAQPVPEECDVRYDPRQIKKTQVVRFSMKIIDIINQYWKCKNCYLVDATSSIREYQTNETTYVIEIPHRQILLQILENISYLSVYSKYGFNAYNYYRLMAIEPVLKGTYIKMDEFKELLKNVLHTDNIDEINQAFGNKYDSWTVRDLASHLYTQIIEFMKKAKKDPSVMHFDFKDI